MTQTEETHLTHHAMLVVWGQYAHCLGLIAAIEGISLRQKTIVHRPQAKVIEFLVAILGGFEYLKDVSLSAHPLDKDREVARAWGQAGWADHSGVSRTLKALDAKEAEQIVVAMDRVSQPLIDKEVILAQASGRLELDGDLSPRPVSNTSTTYPGAAYGHMSDKVGLGFQAALVSLRSPTYGRLGLSVTWHPGSTVSSTQAAALVLAAEQRIGRYPRRRTELLAQRVQALEQRRAHYDAKVRQAVTKLTQAEQELAAAQDKLVNAQAELTLKEQAYQATQRAERPYSRLAKARQQLEMYQRRVQRREQARAKAAVWLARQATNLTAHDQTTIAMQQRLQHFEAENQANTSPIQAVIRLDAGFGTSENVALLIEMGYEVYTKPFSTWLSGELRGWLGNNPPWQRVGNNAEMVAWPQRQVPDFPYLLDVGCERFWVGGDYHYSGLLHFGRDDVTSDLSGWFRFYNARQIIEAANKEGKQVFEVHHLKVRADVALRLQEYFALFAANFIRFASLWLAEQCPQIPDGWSQTTQPQVKLQVKVGARTSAWVNWQNQDCLLRFTEASIFAGRSFDIKRAWIFQPVLPFPKSCVFSSI